MTQQYTAKIYADEKIIVHTSENDVDKLYIWMLTQVNDTRGNIRGEVIHNATQKVVRRFKKAPIE